MRLTTYDEGVNKLPEKDSFLNKIFCIYCFLAPFSVSMWFNGLIPFIATSVLLSLILACVSLYTFKTNKIYDLQVLKESKTIIAYIFIPVLISSLFVIVNVLIMSSEKYMIYVRTKFIHRLINYFLYLNIFLAGNYLIINNTKKANIRIIQCYLIGISILVCIGIWQFLNFYFGVPIFEFNARTHIHGVKTTNLVFDKRLTSLASEPSYLVPFIIDGLIIGWALLDFKKYLILIGIPYTFVLLFSFSSGGYVNIIAIFVIIFLTPSLMRNKNKVKVSITVLCLTIVSLIFFREKIFKFLYPFIGRLDKLFALKSGRVYSSVMPIIWIVEGSIFNILFGFGPGSYKYAALTKTLPNGKFVNETSNNLFGDLTFETGIIGLLAILFLFIYLLKISSKSFKKTRYKKTAFVLVNHLIISSMYRADFVTPRFWIVLTMIVLFIRLGEIDIVEG